jgi:Fe-S cluster biogenesis protein NfuA
MNSWPFVSKRRIAMLLKEKVEKVLAQIRPALLADGGDLELIDVTEQGVVKLRLSGACGCCPMSAYTLKMGIEEKLKEEIPEIKCVEQVK